MTAEGEGITGGRRCRSLTWISSRRPFASPPNTPPIYAAGSPPAGPGGADTERPAHVIAPPRRGAARKIIFGHDGVDGAGPRCRDFLEPGFPAIAAAASLRRCRRRKR
ncbi:MAG: hypothetical protein WKF75_01680 [Singulisphaera sp.]